MHEQLVVAASQVAGDAGSLVDSQIRRDASGLGTMLDGEIRDMISTGNDQQSNGGDDPTRKKKSNHNSHKGSNSIIINIISYISLQA